VLKNKRKKSKNANAVEGSAKVFLKRPPHKNAVGRSGGGVAGTQCGSVENRT